MIKKEDITLSLIVGLLLFSLMGIFFQNIIFFGGKITGYATTGTTISNVSISKFLSITLSTNLSDGILFGTVTALPATNVNASHNYDAGTGVNGSTMFVNVSTDSNTNVDFCVRGDANLYDSSGDNTLGLGNESYANSTISTNITYPALGQEVSSTLSYVKAGENTAPGNVTYYRFWLDVPAATPSGTYNNTVTFKGVETTISC